MPAWPPIEPPPSRWRFDATRAAARQGFSPGSPSCPSARSTPAYGTGPTYRKVGGRVLYTVRDLEDWSAAGERKSTRDKTAGTVFPARPLTPEERGDC